MNEIVAVVALGIRIDASRSLKDKRRVRKKLTTRLLTTFNLSIKETGSRDILNYLSLTAAHVAIDGKEAERFRVSFREAIEGILLGEGELVRYDVDMINYKEIEG